MEDRKHIIAQDSKITIFSAFNDSEFEKYAQISDRYVAVQGKVNNKGFIDVPENATLRDIIDLAGGMYNKAAFKLAQIGVPYGRVLTESDLDQVFDFTLFFNGVNKNLIIMSEEDCIVQYAKFYLEYLSGKVQEGVLERYQNVSKEVEKIATIFDRISKGKANLRDVYFTRILADKIKDKISSDYSVILEIIDKFYDEVVAHIEDHRCYTGSCPQLVKLRITKKCIGCGACVRVCPVDCIDGVLKERHYLHFKRCTHCGQCITVCPVGAIHEGDNTLKFLRDIVVSHKTVITQIAPAVRVTIGEAFGFEPGTNVERKLATALRMLGVDYVFDTTWAADLTIREEAAELKERLMAFLDGDKNVKLHLLTSCCPAWVKFIEQSYPDMLDVPSSVKSPMQIFATIAKDIWAKYRGINREDIISVAIMPCIAKKYEASREEFSRDDNYDTDYVITTKELIQIFKDANIDLKTIEGQEFDSPLGEYTGAGIIFGRTGGVIEAVARSAVEEITGRPVEEMEFHCLRGWEGFRSCDIKIGDLDFKVGIAHGLKEAGKMLDKIRAGEEFYHAIEIMACTGGCIGGGGQPKTQGRKIALEKRAEGLNKIDAKLRHRVSQQNQSVQAIYDKYLEYPMSRKAKELVHTKYFPKFRK